MTNIIKRIILMIYIIISGMVLFNMYNNDYYSFNNKMIFDDGMKRGHTDFANKGLENKYYEDIITTDGKHTFSFYKYYYGGEYEQKIQPDHYYFGTVLLRQNSTGNIKCILDLWEKLDSYVEFTAKSKIRVNGNIYLDIENDGYIYIDHEKEIGDRYIRFVVIPFLILFVFNVPCMYFAIGASFWML